LPRPALGEQFTTKGTKNHEGGEAFFARLPRPLCRWWQKTNRSLVQSTGG
jgi:hypothetical protein